MNFVRLKRIFEFYRAYGKVLENLRVCKLVCQSIQMLVKKTFGKRPLNF